MKSVLVATDHWFPDHLGGAARVAAETAERLARGGDSVDVLVPRARARVAREQRGRLTVHRVFRRGPLPQTLTDPFETWRCARGYSADVLLAHTSTTAVGLALTRPRAPLVVVYHASAVREARFERSQLPRGPQRATIAALGPLLSILEQEALERADRILVLSEFSRGLLAADHPHLLPRVRRVRGGVDTDVFAPGDRTAARKRRGVAVDAPLLVAVRRLEPRMGLEQLLEAIAALRHARPGLRLVLVGDGSLRGALERRRADLALADTVHFAGRVPEAELLDWYHAADVCVLPTVAYEGFGLATAESLACGVPVVGTRVGATPELLEPFDHRLLADRAAPRELAAAVDRALALASPSFSRRCRAYAEARLSWRAAFGDWEAALAVPDLRPVHSGPRRRARRSVTELRSSR